MDLNIYIRHLKYKVGNGKMINYYAETDYGKRDRLELVSIGWIDFRKHPDIMRGKHLLSLPLPPIKLLSLEKVR